MSAPALVVDNTKDKKDKPSMQTALDLLAEDLVAYAADDDMKFAYADGSWFLYAAGFWRVMDQIWREDMDRALNNLCPNVGLVFSARKQVIENHLRASMHFKIDTRHFDMRPYVAVRNGAIDLTTGELVKHSPDHMTTRFIDIDYEEDASCPEWEQMLLSILDQYPEGTRQRIFGFIQEWMGVALVGGSDDRTPRALRKALFLYGPHRAAKSTVFDVVRELLGTQRIVSSKVSEVNQRFGLESFLTAAAWITEEVAGLRHEMDTSRIKCLITGEPVMAQRKGRGDATLRFNGPVGWAGNTAPNFSESSGALYDRVVVIPLEKQFSAAEAKRKFGELKPVEWLKDKGEFPGIFAWALAGYHRLLARGQFEDIPDLRNAGEAWREQNDPVFAFLRECCEPREGSRNVIAVLAWSALMHIKATGSADRWPKVPTLKADIKNAIPDAFTGVRVARRLVDDNHKPYVAYGFALNELGLAYWKQAERENDACRAEGLVANEADLLPTSRE